MVISGPHTSGGRCPGASGHVRHQGAPILLGSC